MRARLTLLLLTVLVGAGLYAPSAVADPSSPDLAGASTYLSEQLVGGDHYEPFGPGFPDVGLTADAGLALAATQSMDTPLSNIADYLVGASAGFAGSGADVNSGGAAKLALFFQAVGRDASALITTLRASICTTVGPGCTVAGEFRNAGSTFSQALGVLALARDTGAPASTVTRLLALQCGDGGFTSVLVAGPCDSDVDTTSLAAQALAASTTTAAPVLSALDWIAGTQLSDGGFPGTAGHSTNSTALALQGFALTPGRYTAQTAPALAFLAARQNSDGGFALSTDIPDSDIRASAQAVSGAAGIPFGRLFDSLPGKLAVPAGTDYLTAALVDGTHIESGGFIDYGLTADIALALAADGGSNDVLADIVRYLAAHVADYADPAGTGDFPGPYSGALAKLALVAEVTGQDPNAFGGFDLLGVLIARRCTAATTDGTCTVAGEFYQSFSGVSQSLGVLALARAGLIAVDDPAVARLEALQCPDGGFSSTLIAAGAPCTSEVDTTGYAVQGLALVTGLPSEVLDGARTYLVGAQTADGTFPGASGASVNSTALAVQALLALPPVAPGDADPSGVTRALQAALAALVARQNPDGGFGINTTDGTDSDVRASAQAVVGVAQRTLVTLSDLVDLVVPTPSATAVSPPPGTPTPIPTSTISPTVSVSQASGPVLAATGLAGGQVSATLVIAAILLLGGTGLLVAARPRGREH